jgi:hypothetical protein
MRVVMAKEIRYALSFTSGSLLLHEADVAVPIYVSERDWKIVREKLEEDNLLQARTVASSTRRAREITQRLALLSDEEIDLLTAATSTERGHLLWVAACRRYQLIGEFAEEVLRERFLTMANTLSYEEFDAFLHGKALWHDEIEELAASTFYKLRANLFRMMVESGLLSDEGFILPTLVSSRLASLLEERQPSDLRFFPSRSTSGGVVAL